MLRSLMTFNIFLTSKEELIGLGKKWIVETSEHLAEPGPDACPGSARRLASFYRKIILQSFGCGETSR